MPLYRSDESQPLTDWNKMMAELFQSERRSVMNSTPESSSGVVSDDHYLTMSEYSESFSSPRRGLKHRQPATSDQHKVRSRKLSTTPSPTMNKCFDSISLHPSPTSVSPQTPKSLSKDFPVYQNLPFQTSPQSKHDKISSAKTENRFKKQIKSIFQVQNKCTFNHPSSLSQAKPTKPKTISDKLQRKEGTIPTRLNDLDDRLLTRIFLRLPSNELCKCAMVCRRWYELVWNPCLWSVISIGNPELDVDRGLKCLTTALSYDELRACLIIESIDLTGCHKLTDRGLYLIAARCPKLKELVLDGCREVTNIAIFEIVSRCIDLESLSLSGCLYVTCISLTPEANLQATTYGKQIYLNHLDMTDCINVDDSSLQMIVTYCSKLSFLYLRRCVKITDVGVQYAASYCNKLQELSISDCPNISDLGMKDISRLESNLRYLSIAKCRRISDAGLRCVAKKCSRLRYLNLRGCDRITDDGITYLAAYCNRLKSLDLGNCGHGISDQTLEALGQCDQLRRLSLKACFRVTDEGAIKLSQKCRMLQQLNLVECKISSRALEYIHHNVPACVVEHSNPGLR